MKTHPAFPLRNPLAASSEVLIEDSAPGLPRPTGKDPVNILLVDDEVKNLTALETVLEGADYRLVRATSADEALLALVAEEFALLILDIQMPGMNGFELATMIKGRRKTANVPIIFLTAYYSEDQHVTEGYVSGAVDFLHKPINPVVLRSKVAVFAELYRKTRENLITNEALLLEIAERKSAQEQLRLLNAELEDRVARRTSELSESESRFRALAEEMPHFVWETDSEGKTTYRNARWQAYAGQACGTGDSWLDAIHPDDLERMQGCWTEALQRGAEGDWYCRHCRGDNGEFRWFHVKTAPVRNAQGDIVRWVGTGTDIHQQRKAQESLREADKRKDEFLAMLGHELRNPLAAIRHAVKLSREAADQETQLWAREVIDRQSSQLARMVDDLLDVERINRGRIELKTISLNLETVLCSAIQAVRPIVNQKAHSLTTGIDKDLWVQGDVTRLEQVFVNLLNNAAKYTPEGGQLEVRGHQEASDAVIVIADNGVGISEELLPYVFDLFTQAHTSLDRSEGGLGIGLTVVRTLVEMHGGRVDVESGNGRAGTRLVVRLPLTTPSMPQSGANQPAVPLTPAPVGLRVLIVDDHVDAAQTMGRLLKRRNYDVRLAHDGPAGLIAAREFQPQVLLLDLGLPVIDGYELARTLRSDPGCSGALFIAISGYAQESDLQRSFDAGFEHHFAKPVNLTELLSAICANGNPG